MTPNYYKPRTTEPWEKWLKEGRKGPESRYVLMTFVWGPAGYTASAPIPTPTAIDQRVRDVGFFNAMINRKLFGSKWAWLKDQQPRGYGALDRPAVLKRKATQSVATMKRTAGQEFHHAHVVMAFHEEGVADKFLAMYGSGELDEMWTNISPGGWVHVKEIDETGVGEVLSYSTKSASQICSEGFAEIILPAVTTMTKSPSQIIPTT